jgi:hypothetical protein
MPSNGIQAKQEIHLVFLVITREFAAISRDYEREPSNANRHSAVSANPGGDVIPLPSGRDGGAKPDRAHPASPFARLIKCTQNVLL